MAEEFDKNNYFFHTALYLTTYLYFCHLISFSCDLNRKKFFEKYNDAFLVWRSIQTNSLFNLLPC